MVHVSPSGFGLVGGLDGFCWARFSLKTLLFEDVIHRHR